MNQVYMVDSHLFWTVYTRIHREKILWPPAINHGIVKCKDISMDSRFEATAANVQDLDDKIARQAREAHKIASLDKDMWMKIHKAEK